MAAPMGVDGLPAGELGRMVVAYADALADYQDEINGLNVYPVPDGDTGTNLRLTLESVRKALADGGDDVPRSVIRGSLMGARGNSGVILSQILRGIAEAVADAGAVSSASMRDGVRRGADLAYAAVTKPQEGTILTVARVAAEHAEANGAGTEDLVSLLHRAVDGARDALAKTPEQLPVLKQAGVVDAGGRGFLLLLECMLHVLDGTPLPEPNVPARSPSEAVGSAGATETDEGSLEFRFEVQYMLEAPDDAARAFRGVLERYGDCVLVVGGDGLYNVHVHTNEVGAVIEEAMAIGRPRGIDVTYLEGQVAELHEAAVLARLQSEPDAAAAPEQRLGLVAVAAGDGILTIFRSFGVQGLVHGGQTFNPSAEEIVDGIRRARAEEVIVLPNNKNVIASARTAAQIAVEEHIAKRVEVVPSESPLQAFSAIVAFDPDASLEDNVEAMTSEGLRTKHAEVAHAVRTADTPAGHVEEGQCIGLVAGQVVTISDDAQQGVLDVLEKMLEEGDSLATLVYGAEIDEWTAHELGKRIAERYGIEVEVHRGGQPHYPFLIGVE